MLYNYCFFFLLNIVRLIVIFLSNKYCVLLDYRCMVTTVRRLGQRLSVQWEMRQKQKLSLLKCLEHRQQQEPILVCSGLSGTSIFGIPILFASTHGCGLQFVWEFLSTENKLFLTWVLQGNKCFAKMWIICVGDDMVGIVQVTCMTI
jgi:hypothetical protein